jgi:CDP-glycerol glycerophosphotransferase
VLYAPTYRDDEADAEGDLGLGLDVARLLADLGEGHVLLVRLHHYVRHRSAARALGGHPRVRDVSGRPDPAELYLAADALVTDYSSAMVDFAVTGRPVLLYGYDLEHYRDGLRGFYLDLEAEGPGPLLTDQEALAAALADLPAVAAEHAERHRRFRERYCPLDDGRATERVLAALLPR